MSTETISANKPAAIDGLPAERRSWAAAAIFTALAMASLDTAIANIALPAIAADLHVGPADVIWVVNVYQIALVATLLPLAALGEIVGHHRIYLAGLLLFTLASLACACAWSLPSLLAARALQGLGASGIMSVNTALVRYVYPGRLQGRGFGHNAMVVATAFTLGPTIASGILALGPWPLAVRRQHSLRPGRDRDRPEDLAAHPEGDACLRFSRRAAGGGLSRPVHAGGRKCRASRAACVGRDRACRRRADRLGADPPAGRSSGADAADRPVSPAAVRAVDGHRDLLVRGPGPRLRLAAVLLRGHSRPHPGRDRLLHDAVAAGGRR